MHALLRAAAAWLLLALAASAAPAAELDRLIATTLLAAWPSPSPADLQIQLDDAPLALWQQADRLRLSEPKLEPVSGRFTLLATPAEAGGQPLLLSGRALPLVELPVLRETLRRGEIVAEELIERAVLALPRGLGPVVQDPGALVGKAARRTLMARRPIATADLMAPVVVRRNMLVTMLYQQGGLRLTGRGRALEDAGGEEPVRVLNVDSKRVVDAVVVDGGTVRVAPPP